jgi:hypothetical protein
MVELSLGDGGPNKRGKGWWSDGIVPYTRKIFSDTLFKILRIMNISEIIPELALKSFLEDNDVTVYIQQGYQYLVVPSEFFTVSMNGSIVSESEDASVLGVRLCWVFT